MVLRSEDVENGKSFEKDRCYAELDDVSVEILLPSDAIS